MSNRLAISIAALMLLAASVLRRHHNDTAKGFAIVAVLAMWFLLAFILRLKWGEAGLEQWRSIRQRGRAYFVFVHGVLWIALFSFLGPSLDFAQGSEIGFPKVWVLLVCGLLVGPLGLWEWKSRERRFIEWQKTGTLPENGVP